MTSSSPIGRGRNSTMMAILGSLCVFSVLLMIHLSTDLLTTTTATQYRALNDDEPQISRSSLLNKSDSMGNNITTADQPKREPEDHRRSHVAFHNKTKPQLVIHIGPPKTATTTIQETLTTPEWQEILALDNYLYAGVYLKPDSNRQRPFHTVATKIKDYSCSRAMSNARKQAQQRTNSTRSTMKRILSKLPCVKAMLEVLEEHRRSKRSILLSDESLGFKAYSYEGIHEGQVSLDWISLATILQPEWDVSVVIVYRRYFDWLPSSKQQVERWTPSKPKMNKWNAQGGKVPGPFFPDFMHIQPGSDPRLPYFFADTLVETTRPHVPVLLVNLHPPPSSSIIASARTTFLCDGLPGAAHSCRKSRDKDLYDTIETQANPSQTTSYDTLVMAADAAQMIKDTTHLKRHDVALQAMEYHQKTNIFQKKNATSFPLLCPQPHEYEVFLTKSLALERKLFPNATFSRSSEIEHREQFEKAVEKHKFCHIDTAKVLTDPQWKAFFESL